jgi:hypothetical protein
VPERVQLSRRKGWRMPPMTVKVDRSTVFGNPFRVDEDMGHAACIVAFRQWLLAVNPAFVPSRHSVLRRRLHELRGKNLACWCAQGQPCHADVLLELANRGAVKYA